MCSNRTNVRSVSTIMTYIDEDEESIIDNLKDGILKLDRGDRTFSISMKQIHCYGEVDFHKQDDLNTIENFKFLNYLGGVGIHIYSNYDYDSHSVTSPKRHALWTETWSPSELAKMAHGYIGKPQRIILFNQG